MQLVKCVTSETHSAQSLKLLLNVFEGPREIKLYNSIGFLHIGHIGCANATGEVCVYLIVRGGCSRTPARSR